MKFNRPLFCLALAASSVLASLPAQAACMTDTEVSALFDAYNQGVPAPNPQGLSAADGECSRGKFIRMLSFQMGEPVGYKAGLTNPAVQKRFNSDAPVWGALYAPMLLQNGAVVPVNFGARALFEADMLVRVSSANVNRATTPAEVLASIDQVIPFIELPDLVVQAPPQLNGAAVTAINVGARLGVMGTPQPVPAVASERAMMLEDLRVMTAVVSVDGSEVDRGKGSDVLEHPLNAVVWLVKDLARFGIALKPGDLISLGSFSRLLPPKAGTTVEVAYYMLPGTPKVKVSFK